ncbi:MAG: non-heme iron oxygenase ferredoxin subunit [Cryobacterium sp.]|nr:non-heme iron oxygenase ferredoxin subunit [Cryobacterium sp.]MBX3090591.1 non-heme iron oxygenase ferredoxin subunit [Cryobacterium sp.]MBX3116270.1 non-heme iron oxygenase ferredoxin subunit [Cryobacterium sp.]MCC7128471.1 non-heme iron oxygenase ferredoxin subunit [Microbacteriaceae bacterium]MCO5293982.1 non-heme iron oxygenase ferredoxin subunit [Homoserinimonas sp.]
MSDKVQVCAADDIQLTSAIRVVIEGQPIALVKDSEGRIFAIGDTCTHGEVSLSEGFVEDDTIECWAHGSRFSLNNGKALNLPAYEPVPVFRLELRDGQVYLDPTPLYDYETEGV